MWVMLSPILHHACHVSFKHCLSFPHKRYQRIPYKHGTRTSKELQVLHPQCQRNQNLWHNRILPSILQHTWTWTTWLGSIFPPVIKGATARKQGRQPSRWISTSNQTFKLCWASHVKHKENPHQPPRGKTRKFQPEAWVQLQDHTPSRFTQLEPLWVRNLMTIAVDVKQKNVSPRNVSAKSSAVMVMRTTSLKKSQITKRQRNFIADCNNHLWMTASKQWWWHQPKLSKLSRPTQSEHLRQGVHGMNWWRNSSLLIVFWNIQTLKLGTIELFCMQTLCKMRKNQGLSVNVFPTTRAMVWNCEFRLKSRIPEGKTKHPSPRDSVIAACSTLICRW